MNNNFKGWYELPSPERTATYEPVSNKELFDTLSERFQQQQCTLVGRDFNYNPNYPYMENVALYKITSVSAATDDLFPALMVVNSGDKSRRVTLMVGAMTEEGEHFIPGSNAIALRKHTKNVHEDLVSRIDEIVSLHEQAYQTAVQFKHMLQHKVLSASELVKLVGTVTMYHKGASRLLTASNVSSIVESIKHPTAYFPTHWQFVKLVLSLVFSGSSSSVLTKVTHLDELLRILYVDKVPYKICKNVIVDPMTISTPITYNMKVDTVPAQPVQKQEPKDEPKDINQILNTHEW